MKLETEPGLVRARQALYHCALSHLFKEGSKLPKVTLNSVCSPSRS